MRCQQREHHDFIHVTANPAMHECSDDLWTGREYSVKCDGVLMSLRQSNKIANRNSFKLLKGHLMPTL